MQLTAENVHNIMRDCMFEEREDKSNRVIVHGITSKFGMHPGRLESHREEIREMLSQLPSSFMKDSGGGWHFTCAYQDNAGRHWGEHQDIEILLCLGMACGMARFQMPRDKWWIFPGGLPYFVVDLTSKIIDNENRTDNI